MCKLLPLSTTNCDQRTRVTRERHRSRRSGRSERRQRYRRCTNRRQRNRRSPMRNTITEDKHVTRRRQSRDLRFRRNAETIRPHGSHLQRAAQIHDAAPRHCHREFHGSTSEPRPISQIATANKLALMPDWSDSSKLELRYLGIDAINSRRASVSVEEIWNAGWIHQLSVCANTKVAAAGQF